MGSEMCIRDRVGWGGGAEVVKIGKNCVWSFGRSLSAVSTVSSRRISKGLVLLLLKFSLTISEFVLPEWRWFDSQLIRVDWLLSLFSCFLLFLCTFCLVICGFLPVLPLTAAALPLGCSWPGCRLKSLRSSWYCNFWLTVTLVLGIKDWLALWFELWFALRFVLGLATVSDTGLGTCLVHCLEFSLAHLLELFSVGSLPLSLGLL